MKPWRSWSRLVLLALLAAVIPGCATPIVTILYVDPALGSDANAGTITAPLRTLTNALSRSSEGWSIVLAAGTYAASTGEVWPPQTGFPPVATANVPSGVTISGAGSSTILEGPGGGTTAAGLVFEGSAEVTGLRLRGFQRALLAFNSGDLQLTQLAVDQNSVDGLLVFGSANVIVTESLFAENGLSGVAAFGSASLSIEGGRIAANTTGAYASGDATVHLEGVEIDHNGTGVLPTHAGVLAMESAVVEVTEAFIHDNSGYGIEVAHSAKVTVVESFIDLNYHGVFVGGTTSDAEVVVSASAVKGGTIGIRWEGVGGALYLRESEVSSNQSYGVLIGADGDVIDLGTIGSPGGNVLHGNLSYAVYDQRPARPTADGTVVSVSYSDLVSDEIGCAAALPPGVYTGPVAVDCLGVWTLGIQDANNRVEIVGN